MAGSDLDQDGWESPEDCDDSDPLVNPGADELPYNGIDEDCDGRDLVDVDLDGWDATEAGGPDCADGNAEIHPEADELCDGQRDEDCDDQVDEGCDTGTMAPSTEGLSWTCASSGAPPVAALAALLLVAIMARRLNAPGRSRRR